MPILTEAGSMNIIPILIQKTKRKIYRIEIKGEIQRNEEGKGKRARGKREGGKELIHSVMNNKKVK